MFGKLVRDTWVEWAKKQENPKPHHLIPWEELDKKNKEVDELIGEAVFNASVDVIKETPTECHAHAWCEDCDYSTNFMPMSELFVKLCDEGGYITSDKEGGYLGQCPKCEGNLSFECD
jgi:hypothetical protein